MPNMRDYPVGFGLLLLVALTGCQLVNKPVLIPDLFEDSPIPGTLARQDAAVVRHRFVKVNFDILGETDGKPTNKVVRLNLFKDAVFTARLNRVEQTQSGRAWIGHIENVKLSDVVFVVVDGVLSGSITMPGATYVVEYAGNGVHAIYEINQSVFPPD
jgi:hypothetical protein